MKKSTSIDLSPNLNDEWIASGISAPVLGGSSSLDLERYIAKSLSKLRRKQLTCKDAGLGLGFFALLFAIFTGIENW